jgi:pimeloyl-ACP methyl ester carboxylesterase
MASASCSLPFQVVYFPTRPPAWTRWIMERSARVVATAIFARRLTARLTVIATIAAIVLSGCNACNWSNHQSLAGPAVCGPTVYIAARPISADGDRDAERDFRASLVAWRQLESGDTAAAAQYRKCLARLLRQASRSGTLDPRSQLTIATANGVQVVPTSYYGFAWQPGDFSLVLPAADYQDGDLKHHYYTSGIGVSLVAVRQSCREEMFFRDRQAFPVTAVLRPAESGAVLEFYNPLNYSAIPLGPTAWPLDRDLSAPFVYLKAESPRRYIEGFLDPGELDVKPKLIMMEPYQRGKIPVVFIHGLGSDSLTWADALNRLRAQCDLYGKFQFWFFRYPTGGDLLQSAVVLREQLLIARDTFDPQHADPALERMVLVGHSMGGLVARLEVSYSYDILWQQAARQPLETVRASTAMREQLRAMFYFDPSPLVTRVVFMATPHRGSSMSRRIVGRAASKLVHYSGAEEAEYRQLMDANHDVFRESLLEQKPTAIQMLEPDNPLLNALNRMPMGRCVRFHSIIGDPLVTLKGEPSDGVVPVSSARLAGACSEKFVAARHAQVNKVDDAVDELARILREHAITVTGQRNSPAAIPVAEGNGNAKGTP